MDKEGCKMRDLPILHRHHLVHIGAMPVDECVLESRFSANCEMSLCRGQCCRLGVDVDLLERDRILTNHRLIVSQMDAGQITDASQWFGEEFDDPDFPSTKAVSTELANGACVFLNPEGLCVLHRAESQAPSTAGTLKPFFCRAYPLCLNFGVLTLDHQQSPGETACCGPVTDGPLTIFDVCDFELEFVLGKDGSSELRRLSSDKKSQV